MKRLLQIGMLLVAVVGILFVINWVSLSVPARPEIADTVVVEGVVESIAADSRSGDISFRLKDNSDFFYINRGVQAGLDTRAMKQLLTGQPVNIQIYRGGFDLFGMQSGSSGHICQIQLRDSVVYTEF